MLLLLPHACDISKQRSCSTRVTNKSADHIGISNLIRGIIHEHLALKRGGNAAGKDRPELVCASRLIRRLEDRSWKYCWKDSDLCGNLDTTVYSRKRRSSTTMQKTIFLTLRRKACIVIRNVLQTEKIFCGNQSLFVAQQPLVGQGLIIEAPRSRKG
jgi:hypothetical protein